MTIKLSDTQLVMLSAAAQREDRCIAAPLKGAAAHKTIKRLVTAGLVAEIKAERGAHAWRRDDTAGEAYALKLTASGLNAIGVEEAEAAKVSPAPAEGSGKTKDDDVGAGKIAAPSAIAAPREGSKLAAVVGLLRRDGGATVDQLIAATGWLPHTTRAALTGLRKRGYGIDRRRVKDERAGAYVIVDVPMAAEQ